MRNRILAAIGLTSVGLSLVVMIRPGTSESTPGLNRISAAGHLAPLADGSRHNTFVIGTRTSGVFFIHEGRDGATCYGLGRLNLKREVRPGVVYCGTAYPSAMHPVLPLASIEAKTNGEASLRSLEGFAADGVSQVELVRANGLRVVTTQVANNTFQLDVRNVSLQGGVFIVARDSEGREIYRRHLRPRNT
jgi:hypothetical protein